jgi:hypothetical protein
MFLDHIRLVRLVLTHVNIIEILVVSSCLNKKDLRVGLIGQTVCNYTAGCATARKNTSGSAGTERASLVQDVHTSNDVVKRIRHIVPQSDL